MFVHVYGPVALHFTINFEFEKKMKNRSSLVGSLQDLNAGSPVLS